jgi:membrane fusion protein (multidrug efflux system)
MAFDRSVWLRVRKALISILIVGAAGLVVVSVARIPDDTEELSPAEVPSLNVEVWEVQALPSMPDLLELPGTLEPNRVVHVPVEQRGRITEIVCEEGQSVKKGDLILRLDTALLQAEFDRAKAQAEFDVRTLERSRELLERGVLNKSSVEEAEAKSIVSGAVLDVARTNLERAEVVAPMTGVLNELPMEVGEYVSPGDTVAQVVDVSRLKAVVQIPERDILYLRQGARIQVAVTPEHATVGQVSYISEVADEETRTTRVEITVDNSRRTLRSGMIVRARIQRRLLSNAVMAPLAAVIPLEEGRVVYVVNGGVAERREVELGLIRGSQVHIVDGLTAGDLLIVSGHRQVAPGQKVNIVNSS